ncbi:MAG TPA: GNAT family protein [Gammaproteobacteria bacterium]|nr:GNAT family protein [Gammaproteobacteria bacterium]
MNERLAKRPNREIPLSSKKYIYQSATIGVRPLDYYDLQGGYCYWFNDMATCRYNSHGNYPMHIATLQRYLDNLATDQSKCVWAIDDIHLSKHIGNISLQSIHSIYRNAEFAIIIGESDYRGKQIGLMATRWLFKHGFERLNLHRIYCGTASTNQGMIKLAEKLGMRNEGCLRDAAFLDGYYVDLIQFGILKKEFTV